MANSMLAREVPRSRLAKEREKKGLTQREVAEQVGVDHGLICRLERAQMPLYPKVRRQLAEFYGVEERELFRDLDAVRFGLPMPTGRRGRR